MEAMNDIRIKIDDINNSEILLSVIRQLLSNTARFRRSAVTTDHDIWLVALNRYERDNLVALLEMIGAGGFRLDPFSILCNGDWAPDILYRLTKHNQGIKPNSEFAVLREDDNPNSTVENIRKELDAWLNRCPKFKMIEETISAAIDHIPPNEWAIFLSKLSPGAQVTAKLTKIENESEKV